jgi:hypothetical protein
MRPLDARPSRASILRYFLGIVLLRSASYVSAIIGCPHMKMPRGDGYRPPHVALSFMRMSVSIRGMFVSELAMFQSCSCVLLGICMLTERVMVHRCRQGTLEKPKIWPLLEILRERGACHERGSVEHLRNSGYSVTVSL